jgi:hypothetical protein
MTPHIHNTRALGNGDTILPTDFVIIPATEADDIPDFMPVDEPEVGRILDGSEFHEYRRYTQVDPFDQICNENGITQDISRKVFSEFISCLKLFDEKQRSYGMDNVRWLGEAGINLRVGEKATRIKWLLSQDYNPSTESVLDSWMDNVNLSLIGILCHKGQWK